MASANSLYKQITQMNNNLQIQLGKMAQQNTKTEQNFNAAEAVKTRNFNKAEAATARAWEKMMSDTSHQREVSDLIAAGLNPVLSANSGANSYTTSAASAQNASAGVDSAVNAIASNAGAGMSAMASLYGSEWSAAATRAAAAQSAAATRFAASQAAAAQRYAADRNYETVKYQTDNSRSGSWAGLVSKYAEKAGRSLFSSAGDIPKNNLNKLTSAIKRTASDINFITKSSLPKNANSNSCWNNLTFKGKLHIKQALINSGFVPTANACRAYAYYIQTGKPVDWKKWLVINRS